MLIRREIWRYVGVVLLLILLLALLLLFFPRDVEKEAVCGGSELEVRVALGRTDERLERETFRSFAHSPSCVKIKEIQASEELVRAPFFYDKTRDSDCDAADGDRENGIDVAPIFFFAGH